MTSACSSDTALGEGAAERDATAAASDPSARRVGAALGGGASAGGATEVAASRPSSHASPRAAPRGRGRGAVEDRGDERRVVELEDALLGARDLVRRAVVRVLRRLRARLGRQVGGVAASRRRPLKVGEEFVQVGGREEARLGVENGARARRGGRRTAAEGWKGRSQRTRARVGQSAEPSSRSRVPGTRGESEGARRARAWGARRRTHRCSRVMLMTSEGGRARSLSPRAERRRRARAKRADAIGRTLARDPRATRRGARRASETGRARACDARAGVYGRGGGGRDRRRTRARACVCGGASVPARENALRAASSSFLSAPAHQPECRSRPPQRPTADDERASGGSGCGSGWYPRTLVTEHAYHIFQSFGGYWYASVVSIKLYCWYAE